MQTRKREIKQKIIAVFVITFMLMMIFGSLEIPAVWAIGSNTTLIQNFVNGDLSMEAPGSLGFNNLTVGVSSNSLANMDYVNFRDFRGTGLGWDLTGSMNDMKTIGTGTRNFISSGNIAWFPQAVSLTGLEGSSVTDMSKGTDGVFGTSRLLINATNNNGMGNYRINSLNFNVQYYGWANQVQGTYQNTLTLTIA